MACADACLMSDVGRLDGNGKPSTRQSTASSQRKVTTIPSVSQFIPPVLKDDTVGTPSIMGSRLVSREFTESQEGPADIATALRRLSDSIPVQDYALSGLILGGAVRANGPHVDSAVNPAWRRTLSHMMIITGWAHSTPVKEQEKIQDILTDVQVPILKTLKLDEEDGMGAYLNEADSQEPDFQRSFWGDNYPRLQQIKAVHDPKGLFIVRKGIGSEAWDDEGLCRI